MNLTISLPLHASERRFRAESEAPSAASRGTVTDVLSRVLIRIDGRKDLHRDSAPIWRGNLSEGCHHSESLLTTSGRLDDRQLRKDSSAMHSIHRESG